MNYKDKLKKLKKDTLRKHQNLCDLVDELSDPTKEVVRMLLEAARG